MSTPKPTEINLHQQSRKLEISFEDGKTFDYSCEYLRCFSPSAEVQGHGPGEEVLQLNKQDVNIEKIEPVGNYAVCLHFNDGHNTGIYSWETFYRLGENMEANWKNYLRRVEEAAQEKSGLGKPI